MPNKPIADWTLGEVKAYCKSQESCEGCNFDMKNNCALEFRAFLWDLTDPPRFDADELAFMRMLYKGGARWLARDAFLDCRIRWFVAKPKKKNDNLFWFYGDRSGDIPLKLFPQIQWSDAEPVEIAKYIEKGGDDE